MVRKGDVSTAKNYLTQNEIKELNRIVTMYLDYAEDQAKRHFPMHMADWEEKLNAFLQFTGRDVLNNYGTVSAEIAKQLAEDQYAKYDAHRKLLAATDVKQLEDHAKSIAQEKK